MFIGVYMGIYENHGNIIMAYGLPEAINWHFSWSAGPWNLAISWEMFWPHPQAPIESVDHDAPENIRKLQLLDYLLDTCINGIQWIGFVGKNLNRKP